MIQLGVNIDHVTSVRNARYRDEPTARHAEPDPVRAAHEAELGGADGITVHLREDRRHIHDRDVERLRDSVAIKLNLEMAATAEMVQIARRVKPQIAMLVPEGRNEVTTEGGLDVAGRLDVLRDIVAELKDGQMIVSAFIDPDEQQVDAAAEAGFNVCELHTGPYAQAWFEAGGDFHFARLRREHEALRKAGQKIVASGMRFNAGHALNYHNVDTVASLPDVAELHIGHAIVARAVFVGLRQAVADMKQLMVQAAAEGQRRALPESSAS